MDLEQFKFIFISYVLDDPPHADVIEDATIITVPDHVEEQTGYNWVKSEDPLALEDARDSSSFIHDALDISNMSGSALGNRQVATVRPFPNGTDQDDDDDCQVRTYAGLHKSRQVFFCNYRLIKPIMKRDFGQSAGKV